MEKDFDRWNERKKITEITERYIPFYAGEVWWCTFGINLGVESDGKTESFMRPAIILKRFNKEMALIVPTTTRYNKDNKYHLRFSAEQGRIFIPCISQIRAISSKRLIAMIGILKQPDFLFLIDEISGMISGIPQTTNSAYAELSKTNF